MSKSLSVSESGAIHRGRRTERDFRETFLTCSLCSETYDHEQRIAKYLPCLHTFCKECLERYINNQEECICPVCRKKSIVPENGVDGIPNNFTVENLKEYQPVFSADSDQNHGLRCTSCEEGFDAANFCHDCGYFLCQACTNAHRKMRQLKGHMLSTIGDLRQKIYSPSWLRKERCGHHTRQDLTLYCIKCAHPVCNTCAIAGHEKSEGHLLVDLDGEIENAKGELKAKSEEVCQQEENMTHFAGQIDSEINALNAKCTEMETTITESFDVLKASLDERRKAALVELRHFCQAKAKKFREQKDGVESLVTQIQSACEFADRACHSANPSQLFGARNQVMGRLEELLVIASKPVTEMPTLSLAFHTAHFESVADVTRACPNLGTITSVLSDKANVLKCQVCLHDPIVVGKLCQGSVRISNAETGKPLAISADIVILNDTAAQREEPHDATSVIEVSSSDSDAGSNVETQTVQTAPISNENVVLGALSSHIDATSKRSQNRAIPCRVNKEDYDTFTIFCTPDVTGTHALTVKISDEDVDGGYNEFQVDEVKPSVQCANVSWKSAFPEVPHIINVDTAVKQDQDVARLPEDFVVTARVITSDGQEIPNQISAHQQGRFSVRYTPVSVGQVKAFIFVNNHEIVGNPFTVHVQNLSPGFSVTWDPYPVVNQIWRVYIATKNENGEPLDTGGQNISVKVTTFTTITTTDLPCAVVDNGDGTYTASLIPRKENVHLIRIVLDNMLLGKGVYEVYVGSSKTLAKPEFVKSVSLAVNKGKTCIIDSGSQSIVSPDAKWQRVELCRKLDAVSIPSSKIAFDSKGRLTLLTPRTRRVYTNVTSGGDMWTIPEQVVQPSTLALTKTAEIIIGDCKSNALFVFSMTGRLMRNVRLSPGCMTESVDNVCGIGGNSVLVSHGEENSIFKIDSEGNSERILQMVGKHKPWLAITTTPDNTLLISQHHGNILVVDLSQSRPVFRQEIEVGPNLSFHTLAIDTVGGYVLALDANSKRILKYGYRGCLLGVVTNEEARVSESSASTRAEVRRESSIALVEDVF